MLARQKQGIKTQPDDANSEVSSMLGPLLHPRLFHGMF
jgi:hypothetical protein